MHWHSSSRAARPSTASGRTATAFFALGGGDTFLACPTPFLIFVVLVDHCRRRAQAISVYGRQLYAVGGNERAAHADRPRRTDRLKISVYVIVVRCWRVWPELSRLAIYLRRSPTRGLGQRALASLPQPLLAVPTLSGGEGTVIGVFVGTVILEVLRNGLVLLGTDAYWQGVFVGSVIVFAVFIDQLRKGRLATPVSVLPITIDLEETMKTLDCSAAASSRCFRSWDRGTSGQAADKKVFARGAQSARRAVLRRCRKRLQGRSREDWGGVPFHGTCPTG